MTDPRPVTVQDLRDQLADPDLDPALPVSVAVYTPGEMFTRPARWIGWTFGLTDGVYSCEVEIEAAKEA